MIQTLLRDIGLNNREVEVYLYLVAHDESIVSVMAKRMGLKRPTVYQALETLEELGLVSKHVKNGTAHFTATNDAALVDLCDRKVEEMNRLRDRAQKMGKELQSLRNTKRSVATATHEKIQYYEGMAAVTDFIDQTIEEDEPLQLCFGLNNYHTKHAGPDWGQYTKKRVKRGMTVRSIQPDTADAIAYKKRDKDELRRTLLVPQKHFPSHCEINIIGDMVAIFSIREKIPVGMKLCSKPIAQTLSSLFMLAWERAEYYDAAA